ncbi:MAG: tetratricopeptide repeat protein [Armatimonadetes bacterium]|nr:tetratricopeptide repeat protein [Armatimonadota bacterium]
MFERRLNLIICLALLLLIFATFCRVLNNEFLSYDDPEYVVNNVNVHGLNVRNISWAFRTVYQGTWQPMVWLSYMFEWELFRLGPFGYHLTNLLLHSANTVMLFLVLVRMTGLPWQSGFVAALFAIHPLHIESVAWIAERKDVLSTLFWMLALWAYARYVQIPKVSTYAPIIIFFALGLMSKPMLVTLPFVLLLLDYWPLCRSTLANRSPTAWNLKLSTKTTSHLIIEKLPLFGMVLVSCYIAYYAQQKGGAISSFEAIPFGIRVSNAIVSYVLYILKMLWPQKLAVIYPHPLNKIPEWQVVASGLALAILLYFAFRASKRRPYVGVGWLWFMGTLVPVIGLVQFGMHAMADRFTYIPLIGLFIVIAWGIPDLTGSLSRNKVMEESKKASYFFNGFLHSSVLPLSAIISLVCLSTCTFIQLGYWKNSVAIFTRALEVTSENSVAHTNLGTALAEKKDYKTAAKHFEAALRIMPDQPKTRFNLGNAFYGMGKIDLAIAHFTEALRLNPNFEDARVNLIAATAEKRRRASANMVRQVVRSKQRENALKHYRKGLDFDLQGNLNEAMKEYQEAIRIDPTFAEAHSNLGVILKELGKLDEAIGEYRKAIRLDPTLGEAHNNLAIALYFKGDYAGAWREVELCRKYGVIPHPDFLKALSERMPEP